jgi:hypothetical protein
MNTWIEWGINTQIQFYVLMYLHLVNQCQDRGRWVRVFQKMYVHLKKNETLYSMVRVEQIILLFSKNSIRGSLLLIFM